jgi:hypothetical protein
MMLSAGRPTGVAPRRRARAVLLALPRALSVQGPAGAATAQALPIALCAQRRARAPIQRVLLTVLSAPWQARAVLLALPMAQGPTEAAMAQALPTALSAPGLAMAVPLKRPRFAIRARARASAPWARPLDGVPLGPRYPGPLRAPGSLAHRRCTSSLRPRAAQSAHERGPHNSRGRDRPATATGRCRALRRRASNVLRRWRLATCHFRSPERGESDDRSRSGTPRPPTGGRRRPSGEQAPGALVSSYRSSSDQHLPVPNRT